MNKDIKIGIILGLNIAVKRMFRKVLDNMQVEAMCKHDLLPALSDDLETITEMIERQRLIIEEVGSEYEENKTT